jgi:hypothetical protein
LRDKESSKVPLAFLLLSTVLGSTLAFLSIPLASSAYTQAVGISVGDSATYSYVIVTTLGSVTIRSAYMLTLKVDSVNATGPVGFVGYTETLTEWNNTVLNPPVVGSNYTTIFDPYVNQTYFGEPWIGWYPFTYTNLSAGQVTDLGVNVTVAGIALPSGNISSSAVIPVNATVVRNPGLIDVNFTFATGTARALFVMKFNSTTGWLESGVTNATAFGVARTFTYQLLSLQTTTTILSTTTATTTVTQVMTTTMTNTQTVFGSRATLTTTQTATSTTTRSSSSVPTWAYATMALLLIVGLAVGYIIKRPSVSKS